MMRHATSKSVGILLGLLVLGTTTACAPPWVPIDEKTPRPFDMTTMQLRMAMPMGWMSSYYAPVGGYFFFTVHGSELEEFWVRRFPRSAVVKGTGRNTSGRLTVQEMAELSLDSRRLDDGTGNFEVISNRPVTIGGQACFRLDYRHRNAIGLEKRTLEYGCPVGDWLYRFEFMAPEAHYFDRFVRDFEASVATVEFTIPGV